MFPIPMNLDMNIASLLFRSMTYAIPDELVAVRAERKSDSAVEVKFETVTSISEGGETIEIECLKGNKVFLTDDTGEAKEIFSD